MTHQQWMARALDLAEQAAQQHEVPVGAVVVLDNQIIGEGFNQPIKLHDPSAHAEMLALRQAASYLQNYRLTDATLYVTLEPCAMCMGAIVHARIKQLVFGAWDRRAGAVRSVFRIADEPALNHQVQWQDGILGEQCEHILKQFFKQKRSE